MIVYIRTYTLSFLSKIFHGQILIGTWVVSPIYEWAASLVAEPRRPDLSPRPGTLQIPSGRGALAASFGLTSHGRLTTYFGPAISAGIIVHLKGVIMSFTKRMLERQEANQQWAEGLLIETGALKQCEFHEAVLDQLDDEAVEEAVKLARQDPADGMTPDEAADFVREALTEYGDECPDCNRWQRD